MNNDEFLIIEQYQIAFKLDDGVILGYDTQYGEIIPNSEGIMQIVSPEIATQIKDHFQIDLEECGVKIVDEVIDIMPSNNIGYPHG